MEEENIVYTCLIGKETEVKKTPDLLDKYQEFCVYHSELCPAGLFPECVNCDIAENALLFKNGSDKINLVKLCPIWKKEITVKQQDP